jgi:pRiA4b ORF-3-like protein
VCIVLDGMKGNVSQKAPTVSADRVYQLHIALRGIRPPVWRRVQVPGSFMLAKVHVTIQIVFGWTDTHLHKFYIDGTAYGRPTDFDEDILNEAKTTLAQSLGTRVERFMYVYDFGDDWVHELVVDKVISGNSGSEKAVCLAGKRHRPPEDCGGVRAYREFLRSNRSPQHEEPKATLDGSTFDPEAFDLAAVNRGLARISRGLRLVH